MVRSFPYHAGMDSHFQYIPLAFGLFVSIFALVALCAKRGTKSPKGYENDLYEVKTNSLPINYDKPPRSPLATPKRLLTSITNLKSGNNNNNNNKKNAGEESQRMVGDKGAFGEGGLWQKNILMGEKCQPLEFSGVIYYDNYGHRVSEIPRSPRAGGSPLHTNFSFPVASHNSS